MFNADIPQKPASQFLYLFFLLSTGMLIAVIISSILVSANWGPSVLENPQALAQNANFLRMSQIIQSFFVLFAPSLIFLKQFGQPADFELFQLPKQKILFLFAALAMVLCQPFVEWTANINHQLILPSWLSDTQNWMVNKEKEISELTLLLLKTKQIPIIAINVAIMVVIPAVCEELLFRGVIQNKLTQWWKNGHMAIIFTAILFSAIHMQFLTFLPRMVMGISLGYLLYYGKSLWLPIVAHLINNAIALTIFYYYQSYQPEINPLEVSTELSSNTAVVIAGFLMLVGLILMIKKRSETSLESDIIKHTDD